MLFELAVLLGSVFLLYKCANRVAESAVILSRFFGISQLAIGFVLIAVSTSIPELAVSITSSVAHEGSIVIGNVFGSNIADLLLVLGLGAFLFGVKITAGVRKDIGLVLLATSAISIYILYSATVHSALLGFAEGIALLAVFALYVFYLLGKKKIDEENGAGMPTKHRALTAFLWFFACIIGVILSAGWTVDAAVKLAEATGIAKSFIGATIIAIGTSLPELSIDLAALRKKHYGLAIGDAIGSTMINITLVLGAGAAIYPITVQAPMFIATIIFAIFANVLLFYFAGDSNKMGKRQGAIMLACYALFLIVAFGLQAAEIAGMAAK